MSTFPKTEPRYLDAFKACVPALLDPMTCLYVGARAEAMALVPELVESGWKMTILEPFAPYRESLKAFPALEVIAGDIRTFKTRRRWQLAIWWHGPEHVREEEIEAATENLASLSLGWIVLGAPNGRYTQGAIDGNPQQAHVSTVTGDFYRLRGWAVKEFGPQHKQGSELVAWRETP